MELQHFSHEHPLILSTEKNNDGDQEIVCNGCKQKISGSAYSCRNCLFFLHKLCAELPSEMKHPMHPEHSLTLLPRALHTSSTLFGCDACHEYSKAFTYHCSLCDFDLDISYAVRALNVEHESHKHPLSPVLNPALFECHACRTKHEGVSYMCNTCKFWIHEDCALLPTAIKHSGHVHPLTLIYSSPIYSFPMKCDICQELGENCWIYHCKGCFYFVNVNCSSKTKGSETASIIVEDLEKANLIHLPVPNESSNLIGQFVKQISQAGDDKRETKLNQFSHEHPLTFFNAQSDNEFCSGIEHERSILNEQKKNDKICDACLLPISTPFYNCNLCSNFFLHKWCGELPNELQHPCHPHPLILRAKHSDRFELLICSSCGCDSNGFTFQCNECAGYYLDVRCASLPSSVVHESHEHPLLLRDNCSKEGCVACNLRSGMFSYGCVTCNFNLHYMCALLPSTITHRYDKHPFILTYNSAIKDGPEDEYYCEFCLKEIDPKWWFYHCADCDQSACAMCFCAEKEVFRNIKWGSTFNFDGHPHPLTFVQLQDTTTSKSLLCDHCHKKVFPLTLAFKCSQCNIMRHAGCTGITVLQGWNNVSVGINVF